MAKSVDSEQKPHSAASDLGLDCLQRPICPSKTFLELLALVRICVQAMSLTLWNIFMKLLTHTKVDEIADT